MTDVSWRDVGGVAVVSINRRRRANAIRRETITELREVLAVATPLSPRGIVIAGTDDSFSAGADLDELTGSIDDLGFDDEMEDLTRQIQRSPLPVLAAVEGVCFGAAIDLAWSCDAVVIAKDARVALPAARYGILYNPVVLARLHARLGSSVLRRLAVASEEMSGELIGASGAALAVEPKSTVDNAVKLLDGRAVPAALAATKELLAGFDTAEVDLAKMQEIRQSLLSAPERIDALLARKEELKDRNRR